MDADIHTFESISATDESETSRRNLSDIGKRALSPESTPRFNWKSPSAEWENTPSPSRYSDAVQEGHKSIVTHEHERGDSPDVESSFCNPEPPVELIEQHLVDADNIGDTVFSKHWLLTTLMKLIKFVDEKENELNITSVDIDEEFQDELCKLWDMSMNQEVVLYLVECKTLDLLHEVITKSNYPRITEISIGILANMACLPSVCERLCQDSDYINVLLDLFEDHDPPTLLELLRLLNTCLQGSNAASLISVFKETSHLCTNILFILQSSTNDNLLRCSAEFVGLVMEQDEELCSEWSTEELVLAIMEAIKQTGSHNGSSFEPFLRTLQIFTTSEGGVEALQTYCGEIMLLALDYLKERSSEDVLAVDDRSNTLCYALSLIKVLFVSWDGCISCLADDHQFIKCILKIFEAIIPAYFEENKSKQNNSNHSTNGDILQTLSHDDASSDVTCKNDASKFNDDNDDDNKIDNASSVKYHQQIITIIYDFLKHIFYDIVDIIHNIKSHDANIEDTKVNKKCPASLNYLNSCSQAQLKHLIQILTTNVKTSDAEAKDLSHDKPSMKPADVEAKNLSHIMKLTNEHLPANDTQAEDTHAGEEMNNHKSEDDSFLSILLEDAKYYERDRLIRIITGALI